MKLDKKQLPQLIVLGALVVGCVGYLSFKMVAPSGPGSRNARVAKPAVKPNELNEPAKSDAAATVIPESQTSGVFPDLASTPARRDPFIPQKLPGADLMTRGKMVRNIPKMLAEMQNSMKKVPAICVKPLNPFGKMGGGSLDPVQSAKEEAEEPITVTGVMRGVSNVVILRIGTGRHVVKEGQTIDGRYRVVSVSGDGAVLVYKNRRIPVKLGGSKNAK